MKNILSIKKLEKLTKKEITNNITVLGVDVAEYKTGICLLQSDKKEIKIIKVFKINTDKKLTFFENIDLFLKEGDKIYQYLKENNIKLDKLIIEDCFFGKNIKTLKNLARFSILIYIIFRDLTKETIFILPTQSRNLIGYHGKGKDVKKEIIKYMNMLFNTKYEDSDICDSIVLGLAGLLYNVNKEVKK